MNRARKPPAGRYKFSKVVINRQKFSVLAVSHVPPSGTPQEDPGRQSRTGDEIIDVRNNMMPDVYLFPNAPHHVARCTGGDVEFFMKNHAHDPKLKNQTWPTGERCFQCPECRESVTNIPLGVMAMEWHLKCISVPDFPHQNTGERKAILPILLVSRRMPRLYHPKCYRRFVNRCVNEWGADPSWDPCPAHSVISFEALPEAAVRPLVRQWVDVKKSISDYDIGLRKYVQRLWRMPSDDLPVLSNMQKEKMRLAHSKAAAAAAAAAAMEPAPSHKHDGKVAELRRLGDQEAKFKNFTKALKHYNEALELSKVDAHLTYHRRSQVHQLANRMEKALRDAELCTTEKPNWVKGYQRKGECLLAMGGREKETHAVMTIACDLDPRDDKSARLLARALDLDNLDPDFLTDIIVNSRYALFDAFLGLVASRLRRFLTQVPGERAAHDRDESLVIDEATGERVPTRLAHRQLLFVIHHGSNVRKALRASACESARAHAEWFASLYDRYVPMVKRINAAMTSEEREARRRDGLPLDIFRRITSVPAVHRVTRRSVKAKEKQGNPKKRKNKHKGVEKNDVDDDDEEERRLMPPEAAKTYGEFVLLAEEERQRKEKASMDAMMEEERRKFQALPPAFESNPMRQYGLSDDYMAQLKRHLSKDRNRLHSEIKNWEKIVDKDPDAMTTEELHKYLTQHGVCLMGKVQREYLVEQVKKLRVYSDLGPVDRITKILPELQHEDGIYVDPNVLGQCRLRLSKLGKEHLSALYGESVKEDEPNETDLRDHIDSHQGYLPSDEFEQVYCSFEPNATTLGVPLEMIEPIVELYNTSPQVPTMPLPRPFNAETKKYTVKLKRTPSQFCRRNQLEAVEECVEELENLSNLADMRISDLPHMKGQLPVQLQGENPVELIKGLQVTIDAAQTIFRQLTTYDSMSKAERDSLIVSMQTCGLDSDRNVIDLVCQNLHVTCDMSSPTDSTTTSVLPLHEVEVHPEDAEAVAAAIAGAVTHSCASCRKGEAKMKCGRCKSVYYCNRECQKMDYKRHKLICKAIH